MKINKLKFNFKIVYCFMGQKGKIIGARQCKQIGITKFSKILTHFYLNFFTMKNSMKTKANYVFSCKRKSSKYRDFFNFIKIVDLSLMLGSYRDNTFFFLNILKTIENFVNHHLSKLFFTFRNCITCFNVPVQIFRVLKDLLFL